MTYIYCAIVIRVKCLACAKLLVSVVLLLLELSVGVGWEWGGVSVHLYFCTFLLSVCGTVALRFSAIVKSDIFILNPKCAQQLCKAITVLNVA